MDVPWVQRKVKCLLGKADLPAALFLARTAIPSFWPKLEFRRERFKEKIKKDTKSANMPPPQTHTNILSQWRIRYNPLHSTVVLQVFKIIILSKSKMMINFFKWTNKDAAGLINYSLRNRNARDLKVEHDWLLMSLMAMAKNGEIQKYYSGSGQRKNSGSRSRMLPGTLKNTC